MVAARRTTLLLLASLTLLCGSASAASEAKPHATFVGDSVSESIDYTPSARRILQRSFAIRFDLATCRRLVAPSCSFNGSTPSTALQAVRALGSGLGSVLIVNVGYNEGSSGYGSGIDRVMRAARRAGTRGVVWLTLRESGPYRSVYRSTNAAIRRAAGRWPDLVVADWHAFSSGRPWFRDDGLHLTPAGADALARFVRVHALRAAQS